MRTVNGYLPAFHAAQFEIANATARYKVVAAGRRFGKGILGICAAFRLAALGRKCRWIAPAYSSDSYHSGWTIATDLAQQILGLDVHLAKREINFKRVTANGKGWLQFRTAEEPEALRGEGIDFVVFDEAAHIDDLETTWEQCVRPSLMDNRGGALFISTPFGFNYFNTLFLRNRDDRDWASWRFPTQVNPHIALDEIEQLRASLPALVARQEIDAEFVQLSGALFKRHQIRVLEAEPAGVSWVRSWDLAFTEKTTSDQTAGCKMGFLSDGTIVIAHVVTGRFEWPEAVRMIAATALLDGKACRQGIEVVGAQLGALQTLLRDPALLPYSFAPIEVTRDKLTRALPLVTRAESGKLAIVRGAWNQSFVDELCAFPEGQHDDQVDASSGGLALLSLPTGALDENTVSLVRTGPNVSAQGAARHFTPRRLESVR